MVSAVTNDSEDRLCICIAAGRFGRVLLWIVTIASDRAALGPTGRQTEVTYSNGGDGIGTMLLYAVIIIE